MTPDLTSENQSSARRVLIYRLGSLGDTLVALPALHLVARKFPKAERRMLTNLPVNAKATPVTAVLEHTGLVDGYFSYGVGTRSLGSLVRLWWTLFQHRVIYHTVECWGCVVWRRVLSRRSVALRPLRLTK
jgi:hypothetical protein